MTTSGQASTMYRSASGFSRSNSGQIPKTSVWSCNTRRNSLPSCPSAPVMKIRMRLARYTLSEPLPVHLLVVGAELPGFDLPPPSFMASVPVHRRLQALFERHGRSPAERPKPAAIDRIPPVMAGPVFNEPDERHRLAELFQNHLRDSDIFPFVAAADVVHGSRAAIEQHVLDGRAMIFDPQPIAAVAAVPVNRKGLIVDCVGHAQRNELLRILIGAVGIAAPRDQHRKTIGRPVTAHQQIATRLAGRRGTAWRQRILFRGRTGFHAAVYLVRADLQVPLDLRLAGCLQQDRGSHDIRDRKSTR